jgi:hypothetical protein
MSASVGVGGRLLIDPERLEDLFQALRDRGFRVVGPTVRGGAIVYEELDSAAELRVGWSDEQEGGTYRLHRRDDDALFGYNVGPQSWKRNLFPPSSLLWKLEREGPGAAHPDEAPRYAFVGVRSCELHAIAVQDRVFMGGAHVDPTYAARREGAFIVAVNCGQAGGTCFCVSMETGPKATEGFDLALTEIVEEGRHELLVEVGTERGGEVLAGLDHRSAEGADVATADAIVERTA